MMKSKIRENLIKKSILLIILMVILLPNCIYAAYGLTLQESTAIEKLMYGEVGSVVKKIEEHFKSYTTLYIANETQLRALAEYVNSGKSCLGKEIILLNDIQVNSNIDWNPIGCEKSEFAGTFDGRGNIISGLTYLGENNYITDKEISNIGLFGVISNRGEVKNVILNDSNILPYYISKPQSSFIIKGEETDDENASEGTTAGDKISGEKINYLMKFTKISKIGNIAGTNYGTICNCSANTIPISPELEEMPNIGLDKSAIASEMPGTDNNGTQTDPDISQEMKGLSQGSSSEGTTGETTGEGSESSTKNIFQEKMIGKLVGLNEGHVIENEDTINQNSQIEIKVDKQTNDSEEVETVVFDFDKQNNQQGDEYTITGKVYKNDEEITNYSNITNFKIEDTLKFELTLDKKLLFFESFDNSETGPIDMTEKYIKKFPNIYITAAGKEQEVPMKPIGATYIKDQENEEKILATTLTYEYELKEGNGIDGFEKCNINIDFHHITKFKFSDTDENQEAITENKGLKLVYLKPDETNNFISIGVDAKILNMPINIDDTPPSLKIYAYVEDAVESNRYRAEKEIIIKATTTEKIKALEVAPELDVSFSESNKGIYNYQNGETNLGNAKHVDAIINPDGTTTWVYSYIIEPGDEGYLSVQCVAGEKLIDLCGNENEIFGVNMEVTDKETTVQEQLPLYADTTAPKIIIDAEPQKVNEDGSISAANGMLINTNITNCNYIKYYFKLDEEIMEIERDDFLKRITVNGGKIINECIEIIDEDYPEYENYKDYSYAMLVQANELNGNISVAIEADTCKDLAGNSNARTEKVITVDTKAPILERIEAYAESDIKLDTEVDTIKENYKTGDTIKIIATFSEAIEYDNEPIISFKFNNGKTIDNNNLTLETCAKNQIVYSYKIQDEDNGEINIRGFSGIVTDIAGNATRLTRRNLDGDIIIADTSAPELVGNALKATREGNNVTITAEYNEPVYILEKNEANEEIIKNINSNNAPILKYKFGEGEQKTSSFSKISEDKKTITYTINVEQGDNGKLTIISYENNNENLKLCDIAGNCADLKNNTSENGINVTNPKVGITSEVGSPKIKGTKPYYNEEEEITIKLTFDKPVNPVNEDTTTFKIAFLDNDEYAEYIEYSSIDFTVANSIFKYSEDKKEIEFNYKIGDLPKEKNEETGVEYYNYGYLWIKIADEQFVDGEGNKNAGEQFTKQEIYVDSQRPKLTLNTNYNLTQEEQKITVEAIFNEVIYNLSNNTRTSLSTYNAPELVYRFGDGKNKTVKASEISDNAITYIITKDPENDDGTLWSSLDNSTLCDRAGNLYYIETTDTTAPILEKTTITTNSEYNDGKFCNAGSIIKITAEFNEEIANANIGLKIKIGDVEKTLSGMINEQNKKQIIFTYNVAEGDNGDITIVAVLGNTDQEGKTYGTVSDEFNNTRRIYSLNSFGSATVDTTKPYVTDIQVKEKDNVIASYNNNNGNITTTFGRTNASEIEYIVTFSEDVQNLDEQNILLYNGIIKEIKKVDDNAKQYKIKALTTLEGIQVLVIPNGSCIDKAGNENEAIKFSNLTVDYTPPVIRFISSYNGGIYVLPTITKTVEINTNVEINEDVEIEYRWDNEESSKIEGFSASDISIPTKLFTQIGEHTLTVKATDKAGNATEATKVYNIIESTITAHGEFDNLVEEAEFTIVFGQGLTDNRKVAFKSVNSSEVVTLEPISIETEGIKYKVISNGTVYAEATDKVGNKVYASFEINNIRKALENFDITGNKTEWTNENIELKVLANTELKEIKVNKKNENITEEEQSEDEKYGEEINVIENERFIIEENGIYIVRVTDMLENKSEKEVTVNRIDKIAPTIRQASSEEKSITIEAEDNGSGIAEYAITRTSEVPVEWSKNKTINTTKDGVYYVWAKDNAGNIALWDKTVEIITTVQENVIIAFQNITAKVLKGDVIKATITTSNPDAIVHYKWYKSDGTEIKEGTGNEAKLENADIGTYNLKAYAELNGNKTATITQEFEVVSSYQELDRPEIIFEGLTTLQINGTKYVKVPIGTTTDSLKGKMIIEALRGEEPKYNKLTDNNKLKTGTEITLNGEAKYIVILNGDVNFDGKVTVVDIITTNSMRMNSISMNNKNIETFLAADYDNSQKIDITDIIGINSARINSLN